MTFNADDFIKAALGLPIGKDALPGNDSDLAKRKEEEAKMLPESFEDEDFRTARRTINLLIEKGLACLNNMSGLENSVQGCLAIVEMIEKLSKINNDLMKLYEQRQKSKKSESGPKKTTINNKIIAVTTAQLSEMLTAQSLTGATHGQESV